MKSLVFFFVLSWFSIFSQGKLSDFHDNEVKMIIRHGLGTSSMSGFALKTEMGIQYNTHHFFLRYNFNRQYGRREPETGFLEFIPDSYNDIFWDFSLMYGKNFQIKKFVSRISLGIGSMMYIDKTLNYYHSSNSWVVFDSDYYVSKEVKEGVAYLTQIDLNYNVIEDLELGTSISADFNKYYNLYGCCINIGLTLSNRKKAMHKHQLK